MKSKTLSLLLILGLLGTSVWADDNKLDLDPNSPNNYSSTHSDTTSTNGTTTTSNTISTPINTSTTSVKTQTTPVTTSTTTATGTVYDQNGNKITKKTDKNTKKEKLTAAELKAQQEDAKAVAAHNRIVEPIRQQVKNEVSSAVAASDSSSFHTPDKVRLPDGYTYPTTYQGNSNLPLLGGYRGSARFLDRSSVTVTENNSQGFIFAENILVIDMNENTQHDSTYTQWFKLTKENGLYVWRSSLDGITWSALDFDMENPPAGVEILRSAFYQGYEIATGTSYKQH